VFLAACLLAWGLEAHAAPKDDTMRAAARSLGTEGVEAYQAGNYVVAADKLERAYQLLKAPTLGLWSARALEKLGKWVQASERYLEVTRAAATAGDATVQRQAQQEAEIAQRELEPRIPSLTLTVRGADAEQVTVTLDGTRLPSALLGQRQPVDPGRHRVEGVSGEQHVSRYVTLAERGSGEVTLVFNAAANAPARDAAEGTRGTGQGPRSEVAAEPSWRGTAGYVGIGVGGAALIFGGVMGVLALGKRAAINDNPACHEMVCPDTEQALVDSYNSQRTLASLGFIGGGVIATAGVTLLLTAPNDARQSTSLLLAPGGLLLRGTY
jgi:hypothetical protein